jgi:hypothetical protein
MTEQPSDHRDRTLSYEIRVRGLLDFRWAAWFDGMHLRHDSDGTTVLQGDVVDQAALHGLLQRVRDVALPLVSVTALEPVPPTTATSQPETRSAT